MSGGGFNPFETYCSENAHFPQKRYIMWNVVKQTQFQNVSDDHLVDKILRLALWYSSL